MEYTIDKHKMLYDIYNLIQNNYDDKETFLDFIYELEEIWTDDIYKQNQIDYENDVY